MTRGAIGRWLAAACAALPASPLRADTLWDRFINPPAAARPMVRWWWFGPAVDDREIDREIRAMKAGGFGGFEVQPTYPLTLDDPVAGLVNIPYLSDAFIARLAHAGATARAEGMRIDVTIGTGWPFGGPHVPATEAAAEIRRVYLPVPAGAGRVRLPIMATGENVLAAYAGGARLAIAGNAVATTAPRVTIYVAGRTGQQVKRAAVGAEGFVIDHADAAAVTRHLRAVGDRLLAAFPGDAPPYAMFSDSLEAYGSSWTGDLPTEFRRRRGYDLIAHLPALFEAGPDSAAVRTDWALTLSELVDERYLAPIDRWAKSHGTRFRAQVYGFPPPTLSSNALVALPEGEGADWRQFTSTRWATSAAHLYDRPVVSSETWTWLHSPAWAATPLDMKVEADRHFLQGVNQLIGHGWPYSPPGIPEPGWSFYAAAALNDHNPWYPAMPAVTRYLTRVSAMLREGRPADRVAVYLPTEDAFAEMTPGGASVDKAIREKLPEALIGPVLDAGFGFDFVDARAVTAGRLDAKLMILPALRRIDAAAYAAIAHWAAAGGIVIAVDRVPDASGGLMDGARATEAVRKLSRRLFAEGRDRMVGRDRLAAALAGALTPDMKLNAPDPHIGFVHRRLTGGDLYFIVNTGDVAIATRARFAGGVGPGIWWDPQTGTRRAAGSGDIAIRLAPYESRFLVFGREAPPPSASGGATRVVADLSKNWTLALPGRADRTLATLAPWSDAAADRNVSGSAVYRRAFTLAAIPAGRVMLDFGPVGPVVGNDADPARPRARIVAPVRDAALVSVNGRPGGTVWAPPYRLDVTALLKPGRNEIAVTVMNTALNALAARGPADLRLLTLRYGERFTDQDQQLIAPRTSGLTGPIDLIVE